MASYSSVTQGQTGADLHRDAILIPRQSTDPNRIPELSRCSVFLTVQNRNLSVTEIINALTENGFELQRIKSCQITTGGKVVITFYFAADADKLKTQGCINIGEEPFHVQDINRPIVFVNLHDVPDDMSDELLAARLKVFGEVVSYRRGHHRDFPNVLNGIRHFRMKLVKHIPGVLRFGRLRVLVRYNNQPQVCHLCHGGDHLASRCNNRNNLCHNCDLPGHVSLNCPQPNLCALCKSSTHLATSCPLSWKATPTETEEETTADLTSPTHPPESSQTQLDEGSPRTEPSTTGNTIETISNHVPPQVTEAARLATNSELFWSLPLVTRLNNTLSEPVDEDAESTDSSAESMHSTISNASTNSRKRDHESTENAEQNPQYHEDAQQQHTAQENLTLPTDNAEENKNHGTKSTASPSRKQRKRAKSKSKK